jgi:hypothetical protein
MLFSTAVPFCSLWTDRPFQPSYGEVLEEMVAESDATDWFEGVLLSHGDKQKIGRENALKLMQIVP